MDYKEDPNECKMVSQSEIIDHAIYHRKLLHKLKDRVVEACTLIDNIENTRGEYGQDYIEAAIQKSIGILLNDKAEVSDKDITTELTQLCDYRKPIIFPENYVLDSRSTFG